MGCEMEGTRSNRAVEVKLQDHARQSIKWVLPSVQGERRGSCEVQGTTLEVQVDCPEKAPAIVIRPGALSNSESTELGPISACIWGRSGACTGMVRI